MPMRRMGLFILVMLVSAALDGCGSGRPIRYYTLQLPPAPEPSTSVYPVTVLIGRIGAPEILEDEPVVYRTGPNEIGTYPYHQWVEPPVQMVKDMLIRQLRASGKYRSVAELGSSAQGDYVLRGRLYDFEEVDTGRIAALVSMEFELFDRRTRKTVWTHYYSRNEPVQGKEIPDVVSALNHNLAQGLTEVAAGLDAYFSANLHGKS
ncbi:MAG: ABC-type transport auxiliary lipoprotein family protein [Terriglobia bacterium]